MKRFMEFQTETETERERERERLYAVDGYSQTLFTIYKSVPFSVFFLVLPLVVMAFLVHNYRQRFGSVRFGSVRFDSVKTKPILN